MEDHNASRSLDWDDRETWTRFADQLLLDARPHASPAHAGFRFTETPGALGERVDALEGFARTFLLAAFRLAGDAGHDPHGFAEWYASGIEAGVDPRSPERWIRLDEHSQAKVEAASLVLGLDMTRPWIWDRFSLQVQDRVVDYLSTAVGDPNYWPNNWVWFRIVTQTFLRSVGAEHSMQDIADDLATHDSLVRTDGWITDGEGRNFDHYVGWALHLYPTLWSRMQGAAEIAASRVDSDRQALQRYLRDAVRLVGSDGSPVIQGRSLTYRYAAAAPFWVGALAGVEYPNAGLLRKAAGRIVGHFVNADSAANPAVLDIGWTNSWPRLAQFYSGPGSSYWAIHGLMGVALPATHPVWTTVNAPMPLDESDQLFAINAPGWLIHASRIDGIVRVVNHGNDHSHQGATGADSPLYARLGYSTATSPLLDDDSWANPLDNAIVLLDADGRATHRTGMALLECRVDDTPGGPVGVAASEVKAHWVAVEKPTESIGQGWPGTSTPAGELRMVSLVRGTCELRLVRVDCPAPEAMELRFGGWGLSSDDPAEVITPHSASTTIGRLTSRLTALFPDATPAVDHRLDATPLGHVSATPTVTFPVAAGVWHAVLAELSTTPSETSITVTPSGTDNRPIFNVMWPDGHRDAIELELRRDILVSR